MPRIPKPKVGYPVWMKNFGWNSYSSYGETKDVQQTDWVQGVIINIKKILCTEETIIHCKFDGFPTRRSATEVGEDYEWVYRKNAPTCKTTQISFVDPRRYLCRE